MNQQLTRCNHLRIFASVFIGSATTLLMLFSLNPFLSLQNSISFELYRPNKTLLLYNEKQTQLYLKYCQKDTPKKPTKEIVEDILCMKPPHLLKNYKNPCWKDEERIRCLPYFMLIGMDKSGSTDLFDRISKHPEILANSQDKETMWWSWRRYGKTSDFLFTFYLDVHYEGKNLDDFTDFDFRFRYGSYLCIRATFRREKQTYRQYVSFFSNAAKTIEKYKNSQGDHFMITGDGTPMDMWDFRGWPKIPQNVNKTEPEILTPHLIRQLNHNTKFIIILRNPVERLYSDYFFLKLATPTSKAFDNAVQRSLVVLNDCTKKNSLRSCLYNGRNHYQWDMNARIHLGFYSVYLKEWFNVFPRDQFYILRTKDYSKNMTHYLSEIFNFLDVGNLTEKQMNYYDILTKDHKYATKEKKAAGPMSNTTRQLLTDLYRPFNKELAKMLGDDRYLWDGT